MGGTSPERGFPALTTFSAVTQCQRHLVERTPSDEFRDLGSALFQPLPQSSLSPISLVSGTQVQSEQHPYPFPLNSRQPEQKLKRVLHFFKKSPYFTFSVKTLITTANDGDDDTNIDAYPLVVDLSKCQAAR